jgi:hypothetical protein
MGTPEIPQAPKDKIADQQSQVANKNKPASIDSAIDHKAAQPKTPENKINKPPENIESKQSQINSSANESGIDKKAAQSVSPKEKSSNQALNAEKNQSLPSDAKVKPTAVSIDSKANQSMPRNKKIDGPANKTDKNTDQKPAMDFPKKGNIDTKTESSEGSKKEYKLSAKEYENIDKALGSQIASLEKLKIKNLENGKVVKETAAASLEKIKSTGEIVDGVATVATMAMDLKGMASAGSKALNAIGNEIKSANKELTQHAVNLALDPINDAINGHISEKVNSKLDNGFMKDVIQLGLGYNKPSYWAQKIAGGLEHTSGDINEIHKNLVNMVDRNINETNDKIDAKIYEIKQQQMQINNNRDVLNMSIDHN